MSVFSETDVSNYRTPAHPIKPLLYRRWSPRAMTGEAITQNELMRLFEAARWAPSCYNAQPWRFIYAQRDTEHWQRLFALLVEFNQQWCVNAAALVVVASTVKFDWGEEYPTHSYDAGAAWQNLALQGSQMGLVVHGMGGFDYARARDALNIPAELHVEAMIAVGRPGEAQSLPADLQEGEKPSDRKPLSELVFEGGFR